MSNRAFEILNRLFQWNETRVHELNYLFWECTTRCNLHCIHCGSDCTASGGEPDMPAEVFCGRSTLFRVKNAANASLL